MDQCVVCRGELSGRMCGKMVCTGCFVGLVFIFLAFTACITEHIFRRYLRLLQQKDASWTAILSALEGWTAFPTWHDWCLTTFSDTKNVWQQDSQVVSEQRHSLQAYSNIVRVISRLLSREASDGCCSESGGKQWTTSTDRGRMCQKSKVSF